MDDRSQPLAYQRHGTIRALGKFHPATLLVDPAILLRHPESELEGRIANRAR